MLKLQCVHVRNHDSTFALQFRNQEHHTAPQPVGCPEPAVRMSTTRNAEADGRLHSILYTEQAAIATGYPKVGLWSIIDGTPYQTLGEVTELAMETPHLYKHDTDTVIAAK